MARNRIRIVRASGGSAAPTAGGGGKVLKVRSGKRGQLKTSAVDVNQDVNQTVGVEAQEPEDRIYSRRDVADMIKHGGRTAARSMDVDQNRPVRTVYAKSDAPAMRTVGMPTGLRPLNDGPSLGGAVASKSSDSDTRSAVRQVKSLPKARI